MIPDKTHILRVVSERGNIVSRHYPPLPEEVWGDVTQQQLKETLEELLGPVWSVSGTLNVSQEGGLPGTWFKEAKLSVATHWKDIRFSIEFRNRGDSTITISDVSCIAFESIDGTASLEAYLMVETPIGPGETKPLVFAPTGPPTGTMAAGMILTGVAALVSPEPPPLGQPFFTGTVLLDALLLTE